MASDSGSSSDPSALQSSQHLLRQETTIKAFQSWDRKLAPEEEHHGSIVAPTSSSLEPSLQNGSPQIHNNSSPHTLAMPAAMRPIDSGFLNSSRVNTPMPGLESSGTNSKPSLLREETTVRAFSQWKKKLSPDADADHDLPHTPTPQPAAPQVLSSSRGSGLVFNADTRMQVDPPLPSISPGVGAGAPTISKKKPFFDSSDKTGFRKRLYTFLEFMLVVNGTMSRWSHWLSRRYSDSKSQTGMVIITLTHSF